MIFYFSRFFRNICYQRSIFKGKEGGGCTVLGLKNERKKAFLPFKTRLSYMFKLIDMLQFYKQLC